MKTELGTLGFVVEEEFDLEDVEVFAKYQNSVNGDGGPTYSDDCNLNGSPCTALTLIDITP